MTKKKEKSIFKTLVHKLKELLQGEKKKKTHEGIVNDNNDDDDDAVAVVAIVTESNDNHDDNDDNNNNDDDDDDNNNNNNKNKNNEAAIPQIYDYTGSSNVEIISSVTNKYTNDSNSEVVVNGPVPNIKDFLEELDRVHNVWIYSGFYKRFNEEEINVKHIPTLTDEEFLQLGVKKMGWKKTLIIAANQYK